MVPFHAIYGGLTLASLPGGNKKPLPDRVKAEAAGGCLGFSRLGLWGSHWPSLALVGFCSLLLLLVTGTVRSAYVQVPVLPHQLKRLRSFAVRCPLRPPLHGQPVALAD